MGRTEKSWQRDGTAGLPSTADIFSEPATQPLSATSGHRIDEVPRRWNATTLMVVNLPHVSVPGVS
jgi:hypothetical protein